MCRCSNEYEYCDECIDRCVPKRQKQAGDMWVSATMVDGKPVDSDTFLANTVAGTTSPPNPSVVAGDIQRFPQAVPCCGYTSAGRLPPVFLHLFECTRSNPLCEERRKEIEADKSVLLQKAMNESVAESYKHLLVLPKSEAGDTKSPKEKDSFHKVPVHMFPETAIIAGAIVLAQGHKKPGRRIYNWREEPIQAMSYIDAIKRHIGRWQDGEEFDEELSELAGQSISHLWAALSSLAIMIDAQECGTFKDNRPPKGVAAEMLKRLTPALKPNT